MIGRAFAYGAISILNALAIGKGVTVGVKLKTTSAVNIVKGSGRWAVFFNGKQIDSKLALTSVDSALDLIGERLTNFHGTIETNSNIPIGVGLKSSSSSSLAIMMATLGALGRDAKSEAILRGSAKASLAAGVSITGAMDDAASCLLGGVNFANNQNMKLIESRKLRKNLKVIIKVPKTQSRRPFMNLDQIRSFGRVAKQIFAWSLKGEYWPSLTMNGMLYSMLLGYDVSPAITALDLYAVGAGLSGTGPALCAVFHKDQTAAMENLKTAWANDGSAIITTETNNRKGGLI